MHNGSTRLAPVKSPPGANYLEMRSSAQFPASTTTSEFKVRRVVQPGLEWYR